MVSLEYEAYGDMALMELRAICNKVLGIISINSYAMNFFKKKLD